MIKKRRAFLCVNCLENMSTHMAYRFDTETGDYEPIQVCETCLNEFPEPEFDECTDHEWVPSHEGSDHFVCRYCGKWYGSKP